MFEPSSNNVLVKRRFSSGLTRLQLAIVCCFLLSSCASINKSPEHTQLASGINELSEKAILLELAYQSQKAPYLCGLASVEMLTRYYDLPLNDTQRQSLTEKAEKDSGVSGADLKLTLEKSGYFVAVFPGTMDHEPTGIFRHLDGKRPMIIMLENEGGKSGHYVVLIGYDPERKQVVLLDPAKGRLVVPFEDFDNEWGSANRFTLLAMPLTMRKNEVVNKQ